MVGLGFWSSPSTCLEIPSRGKVAVATKETLTEEIERLRNLLADKEEENGRLRAELARRGVKFKTDSDEVTVTCAVCKGKETMSFANAKGWRRHETCPDKK